jgi:putative ATPase
VPPHLRDAHYAGAQRHGHGKGYRYSHDSPEGVVAQQYAPDLVADRTYYRPTTHGVERVMGERLARLRETLGRTAAPEVNATPDVNAAPDVKAVPDVSASQREEQE